MSEYNSCCFMKQSRRKRCEAVSDYITGKCMRGHAKLWQSGGSGSSERMRDDYEVLKKFPRKWEGKEEQEDGNQGVGRAGTGMTHSTWSSPQTELLPSFVHGRFLLQDAGVGAPGEEHDDDGLGMVRSGAWFKPCSGGVFLNMC